MTQTDSAGRAVARGFHANRIQGQFQIHVNASFQGQTAAVTIGQSNVLVTAGVAGTATAAGMSTKLITRSVLKSSMLSLEI
jgi:hypothetical protein